MNHAWIFHQAALGDFVLILPMIRALQHAGWDVQLVTQKSRGILARQLISEITTHDIDTRKWTMLHAENLDESHASILQQDFSQAHVVLSFVSDGHDAWAKNLATIAPRARRFFVQPRPPENWPHHVTQWHAQQLSQQGLLLKESPPVPPRMNVIGPLVIHPGSGGTKKCWPSSRFETLIDSLQNKDFSVRVVLGEVEMETWPASQRDAWITRWNVSLSHSLDELTALLTTARLFIGNDSGPTHLAAQLGIPTIALFGPTSPVQWAPRGPLVTLLAPEKPAAMDWLDVDTVLKICGINEPEA